jgi:protein-tyrosine phosphatase
MPLSILFVCLGNICRSPTAEGVLKHQLAEAGLEDQVTVDSAGTAGWHSGSLPENRTRRHASQRGYSLTHRARQVRPEDFEDFDLIIAMDEANRRDLRDFARRPGDMSKVQLFCEFTSQRSETEVPDPYHEGPEVFEQVLDIVEEGSAELMKLIRDRLRSSSSPA